MMRIDGCVVIPARAIFNGDRTMKRNRSSVHDCLIGINASDATRGMNGVVLEGVQGRFSV
jgi:hypothetical protein